jgi:nucleoside-diphosphate-sugar epimerase
VTGGLGFIGANLVHRLVNAGASVRVVDALIADHGGSPSNVDGLDVSVTLADIGSPVVRDVLDGADFVFNLAGQVSHIASMRDPEADLHRNTISHCRFLEMLRTVNPEARVVHTSTRQVYGRPVRTPVDETHPANPVDVNGVAKLAGEQLHSVYAGAYGMRITSLRLTNVYGPRQRLDSDQLGFLPVFVRSALQGVVIKLFGDGLQRRDCLFVEDVVDALLASCAEQAVGRVYNVGHVDDHSLLEIAELLCALVDRGGRVEVTPWPAEHGRVDIGSFRSDSSRIAAELGWRPATELADGLLRTLAFYEEHPWYLSSR